MLAGENPVFAQVQAERFSLGRDCKTPKAFTAYITASATSKVEAVIIALPIA